MGLTADRRAPDDRSLPIDAVPFASDNSGMSTIEHEVSPPDLTADAEAVIASALSGRPLDPDVVRRVTERSMAFREDAARKRGVREIAVNLIREIRDEA